MAVGRLSSRDLFRHDQAERIFVVSASGGTL